MQSGIIPARAGFTRRAVKRSWRPRDHPRSRGVYRISRQGAEVYDGSSPLARGLPESIHEALVLVGIIPARAGFTRFVNPVITSKWDHPRSRGVYR